VGAVRAALTGLVSVIVLAGIAACSAPEAAGLRVPKLDEVPHFTSSDPLPFDRFELDRQDAERMQHLHVEALRRCAESFEVAADYHGDFLRSATGYDFWGGRFGTMDEAHAASWGYRAGPDDPFVALPGLYLASPGFLEPIIEDGTQAFVFYGAAEDGRDVPLDDSGTPPPEGGCARFVEDEIDAPLVSTATLEADLINLSLEDERVRTAEAEWIECMRQEGYDFADVQDAAKSTIFAELDANQTSLAVTDVRCTAESGWSDVFYAILADYQEQSLDRNGELLRSRLEAQEARLAALEALAAR
jgi:hypothetical protein